MNEYREFLVEYPFEGWTWCIRLTARSHKEAEARVKALPWAAVKGEIIATVPASPASIFHRLIRLFGWRVRR